MHINGSHVSYQSLMVTGDNLPAANVSLRHIVWRYQTWVYIGGFLHNSIALIECCNHWGKKLVLASLVEKRANNAIDLNLNVSVSMATTMV